MNKLWFEQPAKLWRQALPIGNGFTSAMIYGEKQRETIAFNDSTLWSGYPRDYNAPKSRKHLDEVRALIFKGEHATADRLARETLGGFYSETFLPLGTLRLRFSGLQYRKYVRELDLSTAVHTVKSGTVHREAFASFPDKVIVYRIISKTPFSMTVTAHSKLRYETDTDTGLNVSGTAPDYAAPNYLRTELHPVRYRPGKGMAFALRTEFETDGVLELKGKKAVIRGARKVTLFCTTATGFRGYSQMPDGSRKNAVDLCRKQLSGVSRNVSELKKRHVEDHRALWEKQGFSLEDDCAIPTNRLIRMAKNGDVRQGLIELFYNYGKYLIAAGSRQGGQPLNLQGQWNKDRRPPWSSNYTVNINTQMNYWGASRANLTPCLEPFLNMVWETMENGRRTAEINYGCKGFACNHNVDLWRKTPPVQGGCNYMFAPLCGVWLSNELYAHYKNGALEGEGERVLQIAEEAARFAADFLVLHDGRYVTCPSASPENVFLSGKDRCCLDYASAFDLGLIRQAFGNYLEFRPTGELAEEIRKKQALLYPFQKGEAGLLEWHAGFETPEKGHRHFSPLYAFYPAGVIGYYRNPEETGWVKELFHYRLRHSGQHIGWSAAWAICLAGRLHEGNTALKVIQDLLGHAVFGNLFCVHPPYYFQIDGNLGFVAGVNEMLLYEEDGIIELLPALPDAWKNGRVKNMLVNGANISFTWKNGMITEVDSDRAVTLQRLRISDNAGVSSNIAFLETEGSL